MGINAKYKPRLKCRPRGGRQFIHCPSTHIHAQTIGLRKCCVHVSPLLLLFRFRQPHLTRGGGTHPSPAESGREIWSELRCIHPGGWVFCSIDGLPQPHAHPAVGRYHCSNLQMHILLVYEPAGREGRIGGLKPFYLVYHKHSHPHIKRRYLDRIYHRSPVPLHHPRIRP